MQRRAFLQALLVAGCARPFGEEDERDGEATFEGIVPFVDEGAVPLDTLVGEGLDGRLYTDLARLDEGSLVVDDELFYVRTRTPDRLDYGRAWVVRIVDRDVAIEQIVARSRPMGVTLLECSGNTSGGSFGLMSAAEWSGVPLVELLPPGASRVRVSGFDEHSRPSARSTAGASWVLTADDLARTGAFLATSMNGGPLPRDHGFPVRLVVPGWYGCTCIKWVNEIALVGDDEPATSHMKEFASRTHQAGVPALARDFAPASIDFAAMPIRLERWRTARGPRLRIGGIAWGGDETIGELLLSFGDALPVERVVVDRPASAARSWTLWHHERSMLPPGRWALTLRAPSAKRTRRLDQRFYARAVVV